MSQSNKATINIGELKLDHWTQGTFYEGRDTSFGALLGLKDLGIGYSEVPPGKACCPFHNHHVEEELFIILEGSGEYRSGERRVPVRKGDVLGAPAGGPDTAHQIINTGKEALKYLSISTNAPTEICEYPDSGKFLAKSRPEIGSKANFRFLGRESASADYWDGEPGA